MSLITLVCTELRQNRRLVMILVALLLTACANSPTMSPTTESQDKARLLIAKAYERMVEKNDDAAERILQEAFVIDPENPWVLINLGVIHQRRGASDLARMEYEKALVYAKESDKAESVSSDAFRTATAGKIAEYNLSLLDKAESASAVKSAAMAPPAVPKMAVEKRTDECSSGGGGHPLVVKQEVLATLESWRAAWASRDIERYLAYYERSFAGDKGDHRAWVMSRRRIIGSAGDRIELVLSDVDSQVCGERALLTFKQIYRSTTLTDAGTKVLGLVRIDGRWFINKEVFSAADVAVR